MEHQAQAAPPCGKESGYSVLNHLEMVHIDVNLLAPSICGTLKDKAGLIFLFCPSLLPKDFFVLQGDWGERKRKRASPARLLLTRFLIFFFIFYLSLFYCDIQRESPRRRKVSFPTENSKAKDAENRRCTP